MVGPPVIGNVIGNLVGERVGEKATKEMGLDKAAGQVCFFNKNKLAIIRVTRCGDYAPFGLCFGAVGNFLGGLRAQMIWLFLGRVLKLGPNT